MMLNKKLLSVLQHQYALFLKSQRYHWNVIGPNFVSLHELFEGHYKTLLEFIDTTAEHIRSLGDIVPSNIHVLNAPQAAEMSLDSVTAAEMIHDLVQSHMDLESVLKDAFEVAENQNDQVVCDFIVDCLTFHRKALWMLRSSL